MNAQEIDRTIAAALRRVREWQWLVPLSSQPEVALVHLREEARDLIELGLQHPERARQIGCLVVAYHRVMIEARSRIEQGRAAA